MSNWYGGLIFDVAPDYMTITGTSGLSGYSCDKISNGIPSETFRCLGISGIDAFSGISGASGTSGYSGKNGYPEVVNWNFTGTPLVSGVAIINHNIPNGSTIILDFSTDNFTTISHSEILTWNSDFADIYKTFSPVSYSQVRLVIIGSYPTKGYFEIGEVSFGKWFQFNPNYLTGYTRFFRENREGDVATTGGQYFQSEVSEQYGYKLSFDLVNEEYFDDWCDVFRAGSKVFIPRNDTTTCYFGIIQENQFDPAIRYNRIGNGIMSFSMTFIQNPSK